MAVPKGLIGTLTANGFSTVKSSTKKELSPQLAAAAKRRISKGKGTARMGEPNGAVSGAPMSYEPGVIQ